MAARRGQAGGAAERDPSGLERELVAGHHRSKRRVHERLDPGDARRNRLPKWKERRARSPHARQTSR